MEEVACTPFTQSSNNKQNELNMVAPLAIIVTAGTRNVSRYTDTAQVTHLDAMSLGFRYACLIQINVQVSDTAIFKKLCRFRK